MMTAVVFPDEYGKEVRKEGDVAVEGKIFMGLHIDGRLGRESTCYPGREFFRQGGGGGMSSLLRAAEVE